MLVFLAALWAFFSCGKQGLLCSGNALAPHCGGSSCGGAQALGHTGFSSCDARAQ